MASSQDMNVNKPRTLGSVLLFSILKKIFFGYFEPENIFLDNENKQFSR